MCLWVQHPWIPQFWLWFDPDLATQLALGLLVLGLFVKDPDCDIFGFATRSDTIACIIWCSLVSGSGGQRDIFQRFFMK